MKKSITAKLFWIIFGTITLILFLSFLAINFFSETYYKNSIINEMKSYEDEIIEIINNPNISNKDMISKLNFISFKTNIIILVMDKNNELIYPANMKSIFDGRLTNKHPLFPNKFKNEDRIKIRDNVFSGTTKSLVSDTEILIYGQRLNNGKILNLMVPIHSVNEAVNTIKQLFLYFIIGGLILSLFASLILSKNVSKPIRKLNDIALEMRNLNFTMKYNENREDEIGELGKTLNNMMVKLEQTITTLKEEHETEKTQDKLRKKFVAQVSHELNTPISIIKGYVEALQDDIVENDEERKYYYDVIENECKKTSKLVTNLLDLSQLEAGTFKMNKSKFDINSLLNSIYVKYTEIAKGREISLSYKTVEEELIIYGDEIRIGQVIENYIQNAFKNTNERGSISIELCRYIENNNIHSYTNFEEGKNDLYEIKVENTGEHIPEVDIPYIWESFYKTSKKAEKKGSGLGLAISKQILLAHGFGYYVQNTEQGVCFGIVFFI